VIDISNELYSEIAAGVRAQFPAVFITGTANPAPPSFPTASIAEISNTTYTRTLDSSNRENHARLMWEINVYSNLASGARAQCREIMRVIDELFIFRNFTRSFSEFVGNADRGVTRLAARYTAIVDREKRLYRG